MNLLSTFFMAFLPVAKIFITCALGAYLGHPNVNILTLDARKLLNKLVVVAFTPAFVFTKLARFVSYENILNWWYMPFSILFCFACGAALGMLVVKCTSVPPHLRNLILACCAAGNSGNVPLILIPTICEENGSPFGPAEVCNQNAVAYISYGMWDHPNPDLLTSTTFDLVEFLTSINSFPSTTGIALTWTVIYRLLQPPDFHKEGSTVKPTCICTPTSYVGTPHSSDFGDFQTGGYHSDMEDFNPRIETFGEFTSTVIKPSSFSSTLPSPTGEVPTNMSPAPRCVAAHAPDITRDPKTYFQFMAEKYDLKTVCNPPTCAAILGLLVGGIPPLKALCEGSLLVFIESGDIIGQAMIPAMNMVLGASLVQGTGASELGASPIIGIILVRLVALPIIGMVLIKIVNDLGMLPPDPLFRFVLMLQYTMPTAINVGTMAQLFSVGEKESALVLLYAYLSASLFITLWIIIYLQYIFE